ncbi:MAG: carboxymuconolactone decarboxylase family protein [Gemmatimonadota bacterium]
MTEDLATAIVRLGAAAGGGDPERLVSALDNAAPGVPPDHIEELLLQTYLFAGFPRAINAFFTWQGWAARSGRGRGVRQLEPDRIDTWRERGERLCRLIYGENFEALQQRLARLHPALADWTLTEAYGKVLSRPGPDPARRELAAIGALIAIAAERQLVAHLEGARRAGVAERVLRAAATAVAAEWDRLDLVERLLGVPLDLATDGPLGP